MKALWTVSLTAMLVACDSGGGGSSGQKSIVGFWQVSSTLESADCTSNADVAEAIGVEESYYLGIREESSLVKIEPLNAIGRPASDIARLPIGRKAEWRNNGDFSVELNNGETQVFNLSSDWTAMSADDVAYNPSGCQAGRYRLRLNKIEDSVDVHFAEARAEATLLGKQSTLANQTLAQGYALYSIQTSSDEEYTFEVTGKNDEYRLNLYDAQGRARASSGSGSVGCSTGSSASSCILDWSYFQDGRYYLLVTTQSIRPTDGSFTLETSFQLAPTDD